MYDQFSDLRVPIAPNRAWLRWLERPIAVAISGLAGFSLAQMLGLQPSVNAVAGDTTGALHHAVLALLLPGLVGVLALLSAGRHHSGFAAILAMICLSGVGYGIWLLGGPELIAKPDIALAQLQYATANPATMAELPLGALIALAGLAAMQVGLMVLFITRSLGRAYAVLLLLLCAAAPVAALLAPTTGDAILFSGIALGVLVVASLFDAGGRFGFLPLVLSTLLTLGTATTIAFPDVAMLAPVAQAAAPESAPAPDAATAQPLATTETPADPAAQPTTTILAPLDLAATYGAAALSACAGLVLLLLLARPDRPHSIWSWTLSVVATLSALVALTRTAWEPLSQTLGTLPALAWLGPPLESLAALPALSPANAVMVLGGALAVAVLGYIAAQIA